MTRVLVAIEPASTPALVDAVERGGGSIASPAEADALVWTDPRSPEQLKALLRESTASWVQLPFAGIEAFFAAGAIEPGRTWTCAKGIYGHSTAEHALALMLMAARRLHVHAAASSWVSVTFGAPERRLAGQTVVIVGTGGIGSALVAMLVPLGPRVIGVNRSGLPLVGAERTVEVSALLDVLPEADFVVLAAALTKETSGLFSASAFAAMKSDAWLVNVARGGLVDTPALVDALRDGEIGGAALDVTDPEPLPEGHPLWTLPNGVITPHVGNTWDMALPELTALVERNVTRFRSGAELEGLVDPASGY